MARTREGSLPKAALHPRQGAFAVHEQHQRSTAPARTHGLRGGRRSSDSTIATFEAEETATPLKRLHHFLHQYPTAVPFIVLLIGIVFFSVLVGGRFFAPFNLSLILQQVTIIGVVGIAQTLIVLTAGIDLSVGAIMVLSSVVMGRLAVVAGIPVEIAFALGLLTGAVCGFINGTLVTSLRLPPFIVTLGTWSIFAALNLYYLAECDHTAAGDRRSRAVPPVPRHSCPGRRGARHLRLDLHDPARDSDLVRPQPHRLRPAHLRHRGRPRRRAARRHQYQAHARCGLHDSRPDLRSRRLDPDRPHRCRQPDGGGTSNLDSITAVVIGGTSLFGGRGSIVGTLVGALIVGVFRNGLALAGLDVLWQEFTVGVLIIVAVTLDQWIRRVAA